MYLHSSVDPSLTHSFGEFPGLGLALVLDVVVPWAEQECELSRNLVSNFSTGRGLTRGPFITIRLRRTPCSDVSNGVSNDSQAHAQCFNCCPKPHFAIEMMTISVSVSVSLSLSLSLTFSVSACVSVSLCLFTLTILL